MQGHLYHHQHQQQQLVALLSAALPASTTTSDAERSPTLKSEAEGGSDQDRAAALNSLRCAIVYPPNSLLVTHSAPFLSQGLFQLLSDRSYSVRQSAAVACGALSAVVCSSSLASNGQQNGSAASGLPDLFIQWALPLASEVGSGISSAELALQGLQEFLNVGEPSNVEGYVLSILKSCQELLEDERTSLTILHQLLKLLSQISIKHGRCFQPHFMDIIDLLLGWALMPNLSESDRCVIMETFLLFKTHWISNLQFSIGLLSKFLGDMEVLIQDCGIDSAQQQGRLLALFSCFSSVLQATASAAVEINLLHQVTESLKWMFPRMLVCLSMVGMKFGWKILLKEFWRCSIFIAGILKEKFSNFYPSIIDILIKILREFPASNVPEVLKANLQLLSLQKYGLLPSSVKSILQFNLPFSMLRLHPNHLVVGNCAATYIFLLRHDSNEVVSQAFTSLMEELSLLINLLKRNHQSAYESIAVEVDYVSDCGFDSSLGSKKGCTDIEVISLIKFDLKILLGCISSDSTTFCHERLRQLASFIVEKINPFEFPIQDFVELQVHAIRTLRKLSEIEVLGRHAISKNSGNTSLGEVNVEPQGGTISKTNYSAVLSAHLKNYSTHIVRSLSSSSPFSIKLEALEWIVTICEAVITMEKDPNFSGHVKESSELVIIDKNLLSTILDAASDTEPNVRYLVANVLERLLLAGLINPTLFYYIAEVSLERLGDPRATVKNAFVRVLSIVLPLTFYVYGIHKYCNSFSNGGCNRVGNKILLNWKHAIAIIQTTGQLHSQQLVSILSYISQRWKVPLSSWIQHLVFSCCADEGESSSDDKTDGTILEKLSPVNNIAAVWWAIHEAARFSVSLRLRTNLGGPTQTFAALERMLLDIAHMLVLDKDQSDSSLNIRTSNIHLLPMRLLLDFVESLKKNVYNAYEGSFILPSTTWQSSLFFRANKKVCEEWFSRISEPMLNAALALQCNDATIHYGTLHLQDLQDVVSLTFNEKVRGSPVTENHHKLRVKLAADVLKVLRHVALALCRSHEPDALIGLQNWVFVKFSSLFIEEKYTDKMQDGILVHFSWITGLVYQSLGQYEKAAAHYSHLLQSEDALSSLGSEGIQFVISRVIESYSAISDWKSLEIWLSELQALRATHAGKAYCGALTTAGNEINSVHALAHFDEGDIQAAWTSLDLTPKSSNELTLDPMLALERSEHMLLRAMLQKDEKPPEVFEEIEKAKLMLDEVLSVAPLDELSEAIPYATQLHCIFAFEEFIKHDRQEMSKQLYPMLSSLNKVFHLPIGKIHQDPSLWLKVLRIYRTVLPNSPETLLFCQKLMSLARKQKNFLMAERMSCYLRDGVSMLSDGDLHEWFSSNLQYESVLLSHAEGRHEKALMDLWSLLRSFIPSPTSTISNQCQMIKARACLKLSTWLKGENSSTHLENILNMIHADFVESGVLDISTNRDGFSSSSNVSTSNSSSTAALEEISGTLIKLSCRLCPSMGKTWLSYSSWCYTQGNRSFTSSDTFQALTLSSVPVPELSADRFQLTEEECTKVKTIITKFFQDTAYDKIVKDGHEKQKKILHEENEVLLNSSVKQVIYLINSLSGAAGLENLTGELPSSALISQLQVLLLRANSSIKEYDISSYVSQLVDIWWVLRRRRVSLFGHAAYGYFQYLSYSSSKLHECNNANYFMDSVREKTSTSTLKATLYILHIILNYGVELREKIESGLASAPLLPWQEITPQLFARLSSHPQREVRIQLEGLLMMLAKLSPWSIVYPTLVDMNGSDGEPSQELQRIFDCLAKLFPQLIKDVQLVINELGNMTILWEEQWLTTLHDLHSDAIRRLSTLKEEARRIADNSSLSHGEKDKINAAKYFAMMAPVIIALERRLASTSREPETIHEEWFQKEYGEQLKSALLSLKNPPISWSALGDVWRPFEAIATSLLNYQRKSVISLSEVAPRLVMFSSSEVPMPGLEKQISISDSAGSSRVDPPGLVTISSFCEHVTILSTKTKPKKLVMLGSDGEKYTYLLKGREDLRLDARIMQLLQAVNSFFYSCTDTYSRSLAIRYYSVTPISGQAGLIQWVDNVVSIYSVFKSWQNRAQLAQNSATGAGSVTSSMLPVPRPNDMFYGKIIPALKEKGIRKAISRRDWPHDVKRKVLLELMKETPKELLRQEIWCASEGFKAFRSKSKRFSSSVAAMSMVGHVLGLGDRHLDNILIDLCNGNVVHIDYNVCFDKGRRLKIPEIVPFRLTQLIEAALGLTGTEGTFKANCEAVFGVLQKNKDVLLMLLEVFVWDPLVEWTRGDMHDEAAIGGEEKKGMELAVSLSLFSSRFQEIRVPLQEHHDLLVTNLPAVESSLEEFLDVLNQHEVVSAIFYHADKEKSDLHHHEASAKSLAAEATSIFEKALSSFEAQSHEFAQAKSASNDKAQEVVKWVEQHGRVLDALRSGSIPEFQALVRLSSMEEALSLTQAVLVAGVPLTVVPEPTQIQIYDLDREVSRLASELDNGLSCALQALHEYSVALQRVLPLNYVTTSPVNDWARILQLSVSNLSPDVLSIARHQATELITKSQGESYESVQRIHEDMILKTEKCVDEIEKVKDECFELTNSIGSDIDKISKESFLSAFSKYIQSSCFPKNQDIPSGQNKHDGKKDVELEGKAKATKLGILAVLYMAASGLLDGIKSNVLVVSRNSLGSIGRQPRDDIVNFNPAVVFHQFEEHIEKCVLVSDLVNELQQLMGSQFINNSTNVDDMRYSSEGNWASIFQASMHLCRSLIEQMVEVVLPEIVRSVISCHSEVMEAFGFISQIRGSIDTALEQLAEVESERASLAELENSYLVKVGLIRERQLALEEAAASGRDHLSWEEAEELTSQEEACKKELETLHRSWNEKDVHSSSLTKSETNIRLSVISSEQHLSSFINTEQDGDPHTRQSKVLLAMLVTPFSQLESIDQQFSSYGNFASHSSALPPNIPCFGCSLSETMWKSAGLLKAQSFFIWKVCVIDTFLGLCIHDISSYVDHNLSFEQLCNVLKKKLEAQLQGHIGQYLSEKIAPIFLACLANESEHLQKMYASSRDITIDNTKLSVPKMQSMLEEYFNAHETAKAAKSAVSLLKRQVNELTQALYNNILEIAQLEWLCDNKLLCLDRKRMIPHNVINNDDLSLIVLNLSRPKLLENLQSAMSSIARSLECLQDCERTSVSAEAQLERAMGWACAGPTISSSGNTMIKSPGIPSEFHDHLLRRRQLLWASQEQASDIMSICTSIMEFEASRDGLFRVPGELTSSHINGDGRMWQQTYLNTLTRLDVTYHSFTRAEQDLKLAKSRMEAAAEGLFSTANELHVASMKAKSATGDLQENLNAMRECANAASSSLSAFSHISRGHSVLTSECASILEEVLAIKDDLPDVYALGKEAARVHSTLVADLSKANLIIFPLETSLSADVTAMEDAIAREETSTGIAPIHGQALHQSYFRRLQESCQSLRSLVPSLTSSAKDLHAMMVKLARAASLHAGNLHKAFEGLGESQVLRSQGLTLLRTDLENDSILYGFKENSTQINQKSNRELIVEEAIEDDWISPAGSIYSSSMESSSNSTGTGLTQDSGIVGGIVSTIAREILQSSTSINQYSDGEECVSFERSEVKSAETESGISKTSDACVLLDANKHTKDLSLSIDNAVPSDADNLGHTDEEKTHDANNLGLKTVTSASYVNKGQCLDHDSSTSWVSRGKNAYALSVLRRVEMKLDGSDIELNRTMSIADLVDHLIQQATSVDNLCNMYEGWTPWI